MHALERRFKEHFKRHFIISKNDSILVALSGGPDSVALVHLLQKLPVKIHLCHVNFQLRGKSSLADEAFCNSLATRLKFPIYIHRLESGWHKKGNNLQNQARKIRYQWFEKCQKKHRIAWVATAHHADDQTETVFKNWIHGTGIKGFSGIAEKRGTVIRPLLPFTKAELLEYLQAIKCKFRNDSTNAKTVYERNYIRKKVLPKLYVLNPRLQQSIYKNSKILQDLVAGVEEQSNQLFIPFKKGFKIETKSSYTRLNQAVIAYKLNEFGFSNAQIEKIIQCIDAPVPYRPLTFTSKLFELQINRKDITLLPPATIQPEESLVFKTIKELCSCSKFNVVNNTGTFMFNTTCFYALITELKFPIMLRKYKKGDFMQPFGMKGRKLLSDLMREKKIPQIEKSNQWVMVDGENDLIWWVGQRCANKYKIGKTSNEKSICISIKTQNL